MLHIQSNDFLTFVNCCNQNIFVNDIRRFKKLKNKPGYAQVLNVEFRR